MGCPLPTGHCHSERSEESRCLSLVISMPINTSRREDIRLSDDKHQKTVFSNARGTIPPPLAAYKTYRPLKGKRLTTFCASLCSYKMCSLCTAPLRGPPIGGQDRDGASYRCSTPYTLSRFAGLPLKGKREIWREKQGVIYFTYHFGVFPFGGERSEPITSMRIMPYDP